MRKWTPDKVRRVLKSGKLDTDSEPESPGVSDNDSDEPGLPAPKHHTDRARFVIVGSEEWYNQLFLQTVEARRSVWADKPALMRSDDFKVDVRGTEDTYVHTNQPHDGVRCEPESQDAETMVDKYFVQRTMTFSTLKKFTLVQASLGAYIMSHRCQYFLDIWREHKKSSTFRFTQAHMDAYEMLQTHRDRIALEPDDSPVHKKLQEVMTKISPKL